MSSLQRPAMSKARWRALAWAAYRLCEVYCVILVITVVLGPTGNFGMALTLVFCASAAVDVMSVLVRWLRHLWAARGWQPGSQKCEVARHTAASDRVL